MFDSKVAREFPGGPVVRTLRSHWARVQSLPRELRSQKLCGAAKKKPKFFKKLKKKKGGELRYRMVMLSYGLGEIGKG